MVIAIFSIFYFGQKLFVDSNENITKVISVLFIILSIMLYWIQAKWIYIISAILIYGVDYFTQPTIEIDFAILELILMLGFMLFNTSISFGASIKIKNFDKDYCAKLMNAALIFILSLEAFNSIFFNDLYKILTSNQAVFSDIILLVVFFIQLLLIPLLFFWGYHLKFWCILYVIFLTRFIFELELFHLSIHMLLLLFMFDGKWFKAQKESYGIIFFDGICVLCNAFVDFILKYDSLGTFRFCSLQNPMAKNFIEEKILTDFNSVVLYTEEETYSQSDAAIQIITALGGGFVYFKCLWIIPRPLRNFVYRMVARNRYLLFGKRTCRVPTEKDKERIIA